MKQKPYSLTKLVEKGIEPKNNYQQQRRLKDMSSLYYSRSNDVSKDYIIKELDIKETI